MNGINGEITFEKFQVLVNQIDSCMDGYLYILDIERDLYYISPKALERFDLECNLFSETEKVFRSLVHKDDVEWLLEDLQKLSSGEKDAHDLEYRWMDKCRNPIWINCRGRSIRDNSGKPVYLVGCVDEIGKRQKADNISGLRGYTAIEGKVDALFTNDENRGYCLHVGIDEFRAINERFGMDYGDFILRSVAECIRDALQPEQEVYRVVADEYIIISPDGSAQRDGADLYRRIYRNVENFIEKNKYETVFTISAGGVSAQDITNLSYTQVLQLTQFALSRAKQLGKNQLYLFEREDYESFIRKRMILNAVKEAVAAGFQGFDVYYQPIMKGDCEVPASAEALLRFRTKDGNFISPYEFIPILEESGLIIPVGKWVMDNAMEFCRFMRHRYPNFRVNFNVSYVQVIKSPFVDDFLRLLEQHQLSSDSMVVELTESGAVEGNRSVQIVWKTMKERGVHIALDDFGTGFSNLLYISQMKPNVVKLDRSFTVKAMANDFERMLMASTIQLVHSLGLEVCVEGIETEEELRNMYGLGADFVQGYYYSKPIPGQEFLTRYY